ncbi:MAG TPA: hypothetical protein VEI07_19920 [Planctomycetaceae bacterium]|nr:hypothetical protein [Planctomycetaceae bacterium]
MTTTSDVQFDHKQWFHDIDRWTFYLDSWQKEIEGLTREYRQLQKMVEQYRDDLEDFNDEVTAHRNRLMADERAMIERRSAEIDPGLVKSHEANADRHGELHRIHERLQQMQQTLATGVGVFRHNLVRGE